MKLSIQDQLNKKSMSRYELAKRIGVTYPTIDNIYKGNSKSIKFEILESLCKELECSLDDILFFDNNELRDKQIERLLTYSKLLNKSQSDTLK